jgi:hypothetical protein
MPNSCGKGLFAVFAGGWISQAARSIEENNRYNDSGGRNCLAPISAITSSVTELMKLVETSVPYGSERTHEFPRPPFPGETLRSTPYRDLGGSGS